jgi:hypothetical protein
MADVFPSPLSNFGLELCFLTCKLSQKTWVHMLTIKIVKIAILPARPVRSVGQTDQASPLY